MSLSEPLGSFPVVHHFYPINPQTALQQQSAVYNTPDYPLVAPIHPTSSQPFRDAPPNTYKKRKIQEVYSDQYSGSHPSGSHSRTTRNQKRRLLEFSCAPSESPMICLGPRQQRRIVYVELPSHGSIDLALYRPISLTFSTLLLPVGRGRRNSEARSSSLISYWEPASIPSSPDASNASEYLDLGDSIRTTHRNVKGKKAESKIKAKDIGALEEKATTCHQCRRKTTKEKMHCRKLRPDGSLCPHLFCQSCIEVRYDENFNSLHTTWHCPRCRGICNCSICLRKAGFGYILDGSISEQFAGLQGRSSVARQMKRQSQSGGAKKSNKRNEEPRVSVRSWLARQGIALGTEEWIMERRRQGVRFVVGQSPPPPDVLSPYQEAQFNPTIAACTEYFEDIDDLSSLEPLHEGDADATKSFEPLTLNDNDATMISHTQNISSTHQPVPKDAHSPFSAHNDATAAENYEDLHSHTLPLPSQDVDPSAFPTSCEDLPGRSSALTRCLKLIVGKPLPKTIGKKKQHSRLKAKKLKVSKPKKKVEMNVSDSDDFDRTTQERIGLPVIRVLGCGLPKSGTQIESVQGGEKEDEKDTIRGSSTISDISHRPLLTDATTPPPPEPVLVPTEYYAPSKLDATVTKGSQTQFGHTYWSFNAVTPREPVHEHHNEHGHGSTSSLLMSTPLYSDHNRHPYPQFSLDDVYPAGPAVTESISAPTSGDGAQPPSESMSLSKLHTPNDYLSSQVHTHTHNEDACTATGLAAFTTLEEAWATVDAAPYINLEMDMSPLHLEGITHAVNVALHKYQSDQQ